MSDHLKPEKKDAEMARIKPVRWKSVSPNTIITTPNVILKIISVSLTVGDSRRNRKAKMRTNMRTEDLHIV